MRPVTEEATPPDGMPRPATSRTSACGDGNWGVADSNPLPKPQSQVLLSRDQ